MSEISKTYTSRFWAKSDRDDPGRIHLLEHHLADVGARFEPLLGQPAIRRRLAHTAGRDDIDSVTAARLCVFDALDTLDRLANAIYQIVIEGASYRERLSPHRALLGSAKGGD